MIRRMFSPCPVTLNTELLDTYATKIAALPTSAIKDAMAQCLACCRKWCELPDSTTEPVVNKTTMDGKDIEIHVVALEPEIAKTLWDYIPWEHEIAAIQGLFDEMPLGELRNTAFVLLWHVKELNLDIEPVTADKVIHVKAK